MTTTSLTPPAGEPWPEAGDFPPPLLPPGPAPEGAAPGRTAHPPLFPEFPLPPTGPKGPASWTGRLRTLPARSWRGRPEDPRWVRPSLLALLAATAVLYLWGLSASGWANSFYSAAAQAGSRSWKAFFYGSSDAGNFITVDKPPLALWPMALSARVFGLSSWSVLAPQALMAVGTVAALYATVRRRFSPLAGLLAGLAFALTPVAALMFRFNNPDALLVLLLTLAAYGLVRAIEAAGTRWLVFTGVMLGLAFLTKTLQAFLVLPAFVLVYLVVAPTGLWRRVRQLLAGGMAMVVAGGWWVAVVELVPASARPYIGGSQDNSFLSLTFGYNGLGRLNGNETGSVGGGGRNRLPAGAEAVAGNGPVFAPAGGPGGGRGGGGWGETGLTRLFDGDIGGQIAWLLPAALILLLLGLWATRRYARTDTARAAFLVWGGWLLCTALTFSFMSGIFHQYYTVALAPAVAALVGMGVDGLWRARHRLPYAAVLAGTLAVTAVWAYVLLGRSSDFQPWLRPAVLAGGLLAAVALLVAGPLAARLAAGAPVAGVEAEAAAGAPAGGRAGARRIAGRVTAVAGLVGAAAALGGPAAYALETVGTPHKGSIVLAGPSVAGGFGPGGMRGRGAGGGGPALWLNGRMVTPQQDGGPGGAQDGGQGVPGSPQQDGGRGTGRVPNGSGNGGAQGPGPYTVFGGPGGPGGMNGLLNGAKVSDEAAALLAQDADRYRWAAATSGSQNAASYQLASGVPVMALGGFNSSDPSLSLDAFRQYVQEGKVHWFVGGGSRGFGGGETAGANAVNGANGANGPGGESSQSQTAQIEEWVASHYTARTVGGSTFYDLTQQPTA
ncbi:ArnT family glycosyltransferase [Kitasatospora purpeofusca]|uniref:ArnT family glycosyltransferase n=1 Tax=Kitasatospora purpeofusca TaxID=67352 RepID=UPI0022594F19|nr:glycosyltransferase family 39 protein [Kitasatospora purpeofusca]MCX4752071.1 glycosyltransferase family 39 protein [Kitasatospora purpeofusca]WSR31674.1 glycosyltransferase family 39 protein [Kitasatospora purpeofusca]